MTKAWRFLPLAVLALVIGAMVWRLAVPPDDRVASKLEGRRVPAFALPPALPGKPGLASGDLQGRGPLLVNIFASWCVPCVAEAPVLGELRRRGVTIEGIAIRDRSEDVERFLARHGDPFDHIGRDDNSAVQIALGSSGVPESFVVDGRGVIRYQHIGPIEPADIPVILVRLEATK